jgi:hypothetical protein
LLLNYLIRNGSERAVTSAREHSYDLRQLESYQFIDEFGKDQGINGMLNYIATLLKNKFQKVLLSIIILTYLV